MVQATGTGFDIGVFANYGVLGLMFVFVVGAMLTGKLVAGWVYERQIKQHEDRIAQYEQQLKDQADRYERDIERERSEKVALRSRIDEQVIPLLSDTGHLLREALRTLGRDGRDPGKGADT